MGGTKQSNRTDIDEDRDRDGGRREREQYWGTHPHWGEEEEAEWWREGRQHERDNDSKYLFAGSPSPRLQLPPQQYELPSPWWPSPTILPQQYGLPQYGLPYPPPTVANSSSLWPSPRSPSPRILPQHYSVPTVVKPFSSRSSSPRILPQQYGFLDSPPIVAKSSSVKPSPRSPSPRILPQRYGLPYSSVISSSGPPSTRPPTPIILPQKYGMPYAPPAAIVAIPSSAWPSPGARIHPEQNGLPYFPLPTVATPSSGPGGVLKRLKEALWQKVQRVDRRGEEERRKEEAERLERLTEARRLEVAGQQMKEEAYNKLEMAHRKEDDVRRREDEARKREQQMRRREEIVGRREDDVQQKAQEAHKLKLEALKKMEEATRKELEVKNREEAIRMKEEKLQEDEVRNKEQAEKIVNKAKRENPRRLEEVRKQNERPDAAKRREHDARAARAEEETGRHRNQEFQSQDVVFIPSIDPKVVFVEEQVRLLQFRKLEEQPKRTPVEELKHKVGLTPSANQAVEPPSQNSQRGTPPWIVSIASRKPNTPKNPMDAQFMACMANLRQQVDGTSNSSSSQMNSTQLLESRASTSITPSAFSKSFPVASPPSSSASDLPPAPFKDHVPKGLASTSTTPLDSNSVPRQQLRKRPVPTNPARRGYWNRRGDHLTPEGYIVFPPLSKRYPEDLRTYPAEEDGYLDHTGLYVAYMKRPELPQSLPKHGNPPKRPYESFVVYA